jgi:hypothetical protein
MSTTSQYDTKIKSACTVALASAFVIVFTVGCSTKNYVRSQTTPIIQQTNDLDTKTAADHRNIQDTDERAKTGIAGAQSAANTADQHALPPVNLPMLRISLRSRLTTVSTALAESSLIWITTSSSLT